MECMGLERALQREEWRRRNEGVVAPSRSGRVGKPDSEPTRDFLTLHEENYEIQLRVSNDFRIPTSVQSEFGNWKIQNKEFLNSDQRRVSTGPQVLPISTESDSYFLRGAPGIIINKEFKMQRVPGNLVIKKKKKNLLLF